MDIHRGKDGALGRGSLQEDAALVVQYLTARDHAGAPDQLPSIETELAMMEPSRAQSAASEGPGGAAGARGSLRRTARLATVKAQSAGRVQIGRHFTILKNEEVFSKTVAHGRGLMPAWGTVLSHQEIADIHAWLASR